MKEKEMAFRILILTGQLSAIVMANLSSPCFNMHFKKVKDRNVAMEAFLSLTTESRISCGAHCVKRRVDCYSFTYDNNNCVLGSWITPSKTTLDANIHLYTVGAFCNVTDKFQVLKNGTSSACVRASSDSLNFINAQAKCKDSGVGVDLYTMKYAAKYYMIDELFKILNLNFWVGLDGKANVFKFVDDGSVLIPELRSLIFAPGEPNGPASEVVCVAFNRNKPGFIDDYCYQSFFYVCERSPNAAIYI